jgi:hypothetical protein
MDSGPDRFRQKPQTKFFAPLSLIPGIELQITLLPGRVCHLLSDMKHCFLLDTCVLKRFIVSITIIMTKTNGLPAITGMT